MSTYLPRTRVLIGLGVGLGVGIGLVYYFSSKRTAKATESTKYPPEKMSCSFDDMKQKKKPAKERIFYVPRPKIQIDADKTTIMNLKEISDILYRQPKHTMEFLLCELEATGVLDGDSLILDGTYAPERIEYVLQKYLKKCVTIQCEWR